MESTTEFTKDTFHHHLKTEHKQTVGSDYLKEIVYGGTDGIVTTFAVVAGFSGAYLGTESTVQLGVVTVLLFGLANLFADGVSMGLGNYISLRANNHKILSLREKERYEIRENPDYEKQETLYLLEKRGLSKDDAEAMTQIFMRYPDYWLDFMMHDELGEQTNIDTNPLLNGVMTFASFCVFGFIPMIPYLIVHVPREAFYLSCGFSAGALVVLGVFSGYISKRWYLWTVIETLLVGVVAASVAYGVGSVFK